MVVDTHDINDFYYEAITEITYLPVTRPAGYITASQLTPWRNLRQRETNNLRCYLSLASSIRRR